MSCYFKYNQLFQVPDQYPLCYTWNPFQYLHPLLIGYFSPLSLFCFLKNTIKCFLENTQVDCSIWIVVSHLHLIEIYQTSVSYFIPRLSLYLNFVANNISLIIIRRIHNLNCISQYQTHPYSYLMIIHYFLFIKMCFFKMIFVNSLPIKLVLLYTNLFYIQLKIF